MRGENTGSAQRSPSFPSFRNHWPAPAEDRQMATSRAMGDGWHRCSNGFTRRFPSWFRHGRPPRESAPRWSAGPRRDPAVSPTSCHPQRIARLIRRHHPAMRVEVFADVAAAFASRAVGRAVAAVAGGAVGVVAAAAVVEALAFVEGAVAVRRRAAGQPCRPTRCPRPPGWRHHVPDPRATTRSRRCPRCSRSPCRSRRTRRRC